VLVFSSSVVRPTIFVFNKMSVPMPSMLLVKADNIPFAPHVTVTLTQEFYSHAVVESKSRIVVYCVCQPICRVGR